MALISTRTEMPLATAEMAAALEHSSYKLEYWDIGLEKSKRRSEPVPPYFTYLLAHAGIMPARHAVDAPLTGSFLPVLLVQGAASPIMQTLPIARFLGHVHGLDGADKEERARIERVACYAQTHIAAKYFSRVVYQERRDKRKREAEHLRKRLPSKLRRLETRTCHCATQEWTPTIASTTADYRWQSPCRSTPPSTSPRSTKSSRCGNQHGQATGGS